MELTADNLAPPLITKILSDFLSLACDLQIRSSLVIPFCVSLLAQACTEYFKIVEIVGLFIHSFPEYLLSSSYGPGTDLGAGDTVVNEIDRMLPSAAYTLVKGHDSNKVNKLNKVISFS